MRYQPRAGYDQHGTNWSDPDANKADPPGPSCEDLCHALGIRLSVSLFIKLVLSSN